MEEFQMEGQESEASDSAPNLESSQGEAPSQSIEQQIIDLDKAEKFRFMGREWTPKEMANSYLMHSDYTKKTQAIAEERKFSDNLSVDLNKVANNPQLANEFLKVYPKKYHEYLRYVLKDQVSQGESQRSNQQAQPASIPDEFKTRFDSLEQKMLQREADAISAELDNKFQSLSQKYPYADEESVVARAQALHSQGTELTDDVWNKLFQMRHDQVKSLVDKQKTTELTKQRELNQKGKDVAAGGGIPGQAPKRPKSIKEASEMARREIYSS